MTTPSNDAARRQRFERLFEQAYLLQDVYAAGDTISVHWPDDFDLGRPVEFAVRLQNSAGAIYAEAWVAAQPGLAVRLRLADQVPSGGYHVTLLPRPQEFYSSSNRVTRELPLRVVNGPYSAVYYGDEGSRRREALGHASRQKGNVFAEIAKLALGQVAEEAVLEQAMGRVEREGSATDLLALLGVLHRHAPTLSAPFQNRLANAVLGFDYRSDRFTGIRDACVGARHGVPLRTPNQAPAVQPTHEHLSGDVDATDAVLFHACEILAGQHFHDRRFTETQQSGKWQRERGEERALAWLQARGTHGFPAWDSPNAFESIIVALSHLADLARTTAVREMAAVVLDKLLFSLALNSFQGMFGSTRGRATGVVSGRLEATSGVSRLLWGQGIWNTQIAGVVSLACAEAYQVPSLIQAIAIAPVEEMWSKERYVVEPEREVNKVTYKTPDFMLASAQDYRPGTAGEREHIWQATLGSDAVVFTNQPANEANFWCGNGVLPRVAQWKDVLIAVHKLPNADGFTHAHFPTHAFDEHALRDGWAFARQGSGYVALTADSGFDLAAQGPGAGRELRSSGQYNVWLCHLGRAAQDGDFAQFQQRILALDVRFDDLAVRCTTLRGETLRFGWQGPLLVDDVPRPLDNFPHYDSPYCSMELGDEQMEIRFGDHAMRLHFTSEPAST